MRYALLIGNKLELILPVFLLVFLTCSCSRKRCSAPDSIQLAILNYNSTSGDTSATIAEYLGGNNFTSLRYTIEAKITSFGGYGYFDYKLPSNCTFDYIITSRPSNTQHRLSGVKFSTDGSTGMLGQSEYCTVNVSYVLDGKPCILQQKGFDTDTSRYHNFVILFD
jgi:hypothetical protein